jgi:hypothetical protein
LGEVGQAEPATFLGLDQVEIGTNGSDFGVFYEYVDYPKIDFLYLKIGRFL